MAKTHWWDRRSAGGVNFANSINMTQQQFQAECDINQIAARLSSGQPVRIPPNSAVYGDFADAPDFQAAQNLILRAKEQFMALPANVRERFKNDPAQLLAFVHDPKNLEEAHDLGLLRGESAARVEKDRAKRLVDQVEASKAKEAK